jgi:hypothetical protein
MLRRIGLKKVLCVLAAAALSSAGMAQAAVVLDLTAANTTGVATDGTAIFQRTNVQPTGTGVIDSFVRVQSKGNSTTSQGYNTDYRKPQYDENNSPQFTRSVLISSLTAVTLNGGSYYQFLLDVNEPNNAASGLLSLDKLKIYQGNAPDLHGYSATTGWGANADLVYSLDAGIDKYVKLDENLNHGSGSGDMYLYVPTSVFTSTKQYLYLYSQFGATIGETGGFEEWATVAHPQPGPTPGPGVPLPLGAWAGIAGLAVASVQARRIRKVMA